MRWVVLVALVVAALPLRAASWSEQTWTLIAQRPDAAGAVHVPYAPDFRACCNAFSGSSASVAFPRDPATVVTLTAFLTALTPADGLRLRAYTYQPNDVGACCVRSASDYFGPARPSDLLLPRVVYIDVPVKWWDARSGEWFFVVEFAGAPTVFGVSLRERVWR